MAFLILAVLFGLSIMWWLGWAVYIAIKTEGKITVVELLGESFIVAATVTETGFIPKYSADWRNRK